MIPLRLSLRNFLSYGDAVQTVDFVPHHLICLSGKNGHGKSALLDAMTWAIWGQARKTGGVAKADHGLVRLGQKSMTVTFDFAFNGSTYRIKREFTLTSGKAFVWLEFGLLDENTNTIITLNEKSITATQRKIEQLLGLDYDAFVNSSFLRQGNSNEFSKKSAKERKEVLCSILGLAQFEDIKKRATEKMRQLLAAQEATQAAQDRVTQQLAQRTVIEQLQQELAVVAPELQTVEQQIQQERVYQQEEQANIQQLQTTYSIIQAQLQQHESAYTTGWQQLQSVMQRRRQSRSLLFGNAIGQHHQQIQVLKQQVVQLDALQERHGTVTQQLTTLQQQVRQLEFARTLAAQLKQLQGHILQATNQIIQLRQETSQLASLQARLHKGKEGYARVVALGNQTQAEYHKVQGQVTSLQAVHTAACPLCTQQLDAHVQQRLTNKLMQQSQHLMQRVSRIANFLACTKERLAGEHTRLKAIEQQQELLQRLTTQTEQYVLQEKQLEQQLQALQVGTDIAHIESQWQQMQVELGQLQQDAALQYQAAVHKQLVKELQELLAQETIVADSNALRATVQEVTHSLYQLIDSLKGIRQARHTTQAQLAALPSSSQVQQQLQERTQKITLLEQRALVLQQQTNRLTATIQAQQTMVQQLEQEQARHAELLATYAQQIDDFKTIAQAFSKDGIQALLIEQAIPEIEAEANKLLARLTDNSAQIMIESLRDLKTGGSKETLDIKISDTIGIRPYEMFSGGEAFRIDFALRIAIAKLLARRAGTCLQTLIIDEGFGSQDDDGLQHMMDALYAIQEDFAKVIVVSHLPTMKESFPVHFVVNKGPNGSTIQVVQQG